MLHVRGKDTKWDPPIIAANEGASGGGLEVEVGPTSGVMQCGGAMWKPVQWCPSVIKIFYYL
jgi:hypothetical protein